MWWLFLKIVVLICVLLAVVFFFWWKLIKGLGKIEINDWLNKEDD